MSRDDLHFRLRIPEDLKSRVEAAAKASRRSITAEIVAALEERFPRQTQLDHVETALALLKSALFADKPDRDRTMKALDDLEEDLAALKSYILRGLKQE